MRKTTVRLIAIALVLLMALALIPLAAWADGSYTVHFEKNAADATGEMQDQIFPEGQTVPLTPCGFKRSGYTCTGWTVNADGSGAFYSNGASYALTQDLTLYAKWQANPVVIYCANYENSPENETQMVPYNTSTALTPPSFSRNGYSFVGWRVNADGSGTYYNGTEAVTLTQNLTLYAQWQQDTPAPTVYTLRFAANGGTGNMDAMTNTTGTFTLPGCTFSKENSTFLGWSMYETAESPASLYNPGRDFVLPAGSQDWTVYAQWGSNSPVTYTITLNPNGGTVSTTTIPVTAGNQIGSLPTPSWDSSHIFTGWRDETGSSVTGSTVPQRDMELTARWVVDGGSTTRVVHFNGNGAEGSMTDMSAPDDTAINAPQCAFTPPSGQRFTGWNTMANGSGTAYAVGSPIGFSAEFPEITLYAQWSAETVQVTVYFNDYGVVLYGSTPVASSGRAVTVPKGVSTAFNYGPISGCRVKSVMLNGVDVTSQSTLMFNSNSTLSVVFEKGFPGTDFSAAVASGTPVTNPSGMVETIYDIKPILKQTVTASDRQNVYPTSPVSFIIPYPKQGMNAVNYSYSLYHLPDGTLVPTTATDRGLEGSSVNFSDFSMEAVPNSNVLSGIVEISGSPIIGNTLTATATTNNTGILTYTWKRGGTVVATGQSYTTSSLDNGATLVCEVTSSVQSGIIKSDPVYPSYVPNPVVLSYIYFGDKIKTGEIGNVAPGMEYATDVKGPWYHLTTSTLTGLTDPGTYYFRIPNTTSMGSVELKAFSWVTAETIYGKGSVTPSSDTVENGSNLVLQFAPRKNYQVAEVRVNGTRVPNMRNTTYLNLKNINGRADVQVGFYYAGNTPHTGDDSHLGAWSAVAAFSLLGLGAALAALKKKSRG